MERQPVVSREYKVMLRPGRFEGDEKKLLGTTGLVWNDFSKLTAGVALGTKGDLAAIATRRIVTFLDTAKRHLNAANYIFRERRNLESAEREVTLKLRHPDRHFAQARDMRAKGGKRARTKFEEDIKAPFLSLYSFSTTIAIGQDKTFDTLKDVARLFPDIGQRIDGFNDDRALIVVNGFAARELVVGGASVQLGKTPSVDAECALIVWYDDKGRLDVPIAVELSYRYADKGERYGGTMARRAFDLFELLPEKLEKWVAPRSRTKTALVYG